MLGILWGFGDTAGIGKLGLLPQGAFSLWGRTNAEEAVPSLKRQLQAGVLLRDSLGVGQRVISGLIL